MVSPARNLDLLDDERLAPPVSQGTLQTTDGAALPLEHTDVLATIAGPLADVTVRQRFRNDRSVAIEAVYLFPLPPEASVYELRFRIEDRVVEGIVKERAAARRDYEAALAQGRAATLLEEDTPSLFSLSVANIAPGAVIEVELRYQDLLAYDDGRWRFAFPMAAPPRYRDAAVEAGAVAPPRALDDTRTADVSLRARFAPTLAVEELACASHLVSIDRDDDGALFAALRVDGPVANRDFLLTWRAAEEGVRPWLYLERTPAMPGTFLLVLTPSIPRATTERAGGEGDFKAVRCGNCGGVVKDLTAIREIPGLGPVLPCAYCGAVLAPGVDVITQPKRARDVIVLVDRSASMRGSEGACAMALRAVLEALAPGDGVHVVMFDHDRVTMPGHEGRFVAVSPELVRAAEDFVRATPPRGGSELEAALALSTEMPAREGRTRVVVLVSDVSAGNEARLLRRVPTLLGAGAKLFVLGVGESLDRRLATRVARAGGGVFEALPGGGGAAESLARFGRRVRDAGPVLMGVSLYWEGAAMRDVEPVTVPDLHGGEALRVLGRFDGEGATQLVITATTSEGKPFRQELSVTLPKESRQTPGLERAWARRRVERLAELTDKEPANPGHAKDGLALSLQWSIVSRWTSLVAEDRKVSVGPKRARKAKLYREDGVVALTLDGRRRTIGRSSEADAYVADGNVSRLHTEVVFDGEFFIARDLASTNGTYINGVRTREAKLLDGMMIQLGDVKFRVVFSTGESPDGFFEFVPTQRAVDARSGDAGRQGAAVHADEHAALEGAIAPRVTSSKVQCGVCGYVMVDNVQFCMQCGAPLHRAGEAAKRGAPVGVPLPPAPAPYAPMGAPPAFGGMPAMGAMPAMGGMPAMGASPIPMGVPGAPSAAPMPGGPPPPRPAPMPAMAPQRLRSAASESERAPVPPMAPMAPPMAAPMAHPMAAPMAHPMAAPMAPPLAPSPFAGLPPQPVPGGPPLHPSMMPGLGPPPAMRPVMGPPIAGYAPPIAPAMPSAPMRRDAAPMQPARGQAPQVPVRVPGSEAYPEHELKWLSSRLRGELDLVFLVDATGSMGPHIAEVRTRLLELIDALRASPLCRSLRLGVVSYRDHEPQERTYLTRVTPLTADLDAARTAVLSLSAAGGGDGPEAVTDGLFDVVRLDWRPGAARAVAWFGDAPPHGVEHTGDAFPEGCPCGNHWYTQAENLREMGVAVYAIGCLPTLRGYDGAEAVYRKVARATRGMFIPLREAALLVPLIAGAAESALDGQRIDAYLEALLISSGHALRGIDHDERVRWITERFRAEGLRARVIEGDAERLGALPLRFREVTPMDVRASLARLRSAGRLMV
jgi:Mg-chelatase subunit ChlD